MVRQQYHLLLIVQLDPVAALRREDADLVLFPVPLLVVLEIEGVAVAGDDLLVLIVLVHGLFQDLVAVLGDAADHIGLFDVSLLKCQEHLSPGLRQEIMPPARAPRGHGHPHPLQLVGALVPHRHGHADPARHILVIILHDLPDDHPQDPVVPGVGLHHLLLCNIVDHIVQSHPLRPFL